MGTLEKHIVRWHGLPVADPVSVLYCWEAAVNFNTQLRAFYNAFATYLPTSVTITIDDAGDELDEATGAPVGTWTNTTTATVTGSTAAAYTGGSGCLVWWNTNVVVGRRRLRGRTFLVPLAVATDSTGTLSTAFLSAANSAAYNLINDSGANFVAWHRPIADLGGVARSVETATIYDRPAFLTSRRA